MDQVSKRYSDPCFFMDGMIQTGRFYEFVIDFIRIMPGAPKANVKSRIILTPEHAKRLMIALQDNISKFEHHNGKINTPGNGQATPPIPMGFGGGEA